MCAFVGALVAAGLSGSAVHADETSGSGFFVNEAGWLMTNAHVVDGCSAVEVRGVVAVSVIVDTSADLALVHVPQPAGNTRLILRVNGVELAEPLALVGYPLPALLSEGVKITVGVASALVGAVGDPRYFQSTAPAQPGNSGGPLLDENGMVLGVFAARLSEDVATGAQNVNFALHAAEALRFLVASDVAHRSQIWPRGAVVNIGGPTISDRAVDASEAVALVRCLP